MAKKRVSFISKDLKKILDNAVGSNYNMGLSIFNLGLTLTGKALLWHIKRDKALRETAGTAIPNIEVLNCTAASL